MLSSTDTNFMICLFEFERFSIVSLFFSFVTHTVYNRKVYNMTNQHFEYIHYKVVTLSSFAFCVNPCNPPKIFRNGKYNLYWPLIMISLYYILYHVMKMYPYFHYILYMYFLCKHFFMKNVAETNK